MQYFNKLSNKNQTLSSSV